MGEGGGKETKTDGVREAKKEFYVARFELVEST